MDKNSKIYIAGHTGFIGSALTKRLIGLGYKNLILRTHKEADLTDQHKVMKLFNDARPEYVFLMASKTGGILSNSSHPAGFIYYNLAIQTNIIHAAYMSKVKKLLFPGSACMYPKFCPQPIRPKYLLTSAIEPTNEPFAVAKISGVKMCHAYNKEYGTNFICVVPATVYGPGDHFDAGGHVISGLIGKFYNAFSENDKEVVVWGTGKPKRDFIYIDDVVDAFVLLMRKYDGREIVNVGAGEEISIKELAVKIKDIIGFKGKIKYDASKPDGIPRRFLDTFEMSKLGFKPRISIDTGLRLTCKWFNDNS